jgi:hypothetical protein
MMTLTIVSILFGLVLGTRFKVLVLFPAIFISAVLIVGAGIEHGNGGWAILLDFVLSATGLQLGFLGGTATRAFIAAARAPRPRGREGHAAASRSAG